MQADSGWVLYIIECEDGTFYTGITTDLNRRIIEHESGKGAKYTKGRGRLKVIYTEKCCSRSAALKRELQIKALSKNSKIQLVEKSSGI